MNKIILLENGIRLAFLNIPHVHSVSFGCFFGAGSAFETPENNGVSHFIEHMCFKGTSKRSAFDIVCDTDRLGANVNAYTSKETTCYYIQCLDEQAETCMEILSDIVCNHTFPEDEMEKEKEVVVEEIKMCEDTPDDLCSELASTAFWGDNPLGMNILGTAESVHSFKREDLIAYEEKRYVANNLVISIAGNIEEERAIELCEKYFGNFREGKKPEGMKNTQSNCGGVLTSTKQNEQANVCLTFNGVSRENLSELMAIKIMCTCFGGNMSSVLFQRLREEMGLAYNVYAYQSAYQTGGAVTIYLGTSPKKLKTALREIKKVIDEYRENGFSPDEFERGVNQQKTAYLMGLESSISLMRVNGERCLATNKPFDADAEIEIINSITLEDMNNVFKKVFDSTPSIGYVGVETDFDLQEFFKK